jgi:hypothetical protein
VHCTGETGLKKMLLPECAYVVAKYLRREKPQHADIQGCFEEGRYCQSVRMPLLSIYDDKSRNMLIHKAF